MAGQRTKKSFLLRIDPDLWAELEALAAHELRSVNAQIEYMLRDSVRRRGRPVPKVNGEDGDAEP